LLGRFEVGAIPLVAVLTNARAHVVEKIVRAIGVEPSADASVRVP
jgi:hypothetical protein